MGKNGNVCTGTAPSAGQYTFGTGTCIRDTACSSSRCTYQTTQDWTDPTGYVGIGYSEAEHQRNRRSIFYTKRPEHFSAKELPDIQGGLTAQTIMSNTGPVSGSSVYVCYKISIPTQPSGYYYNIAK